MTTSVLRRACRTVATGLGSVLVALVIALMPQPAAAQAIGSGPSAVPVDPPETADDSGVIDRYRDRYQSIRDRGISFKLGSIVPGSHLAAGIGWEQDRLFGMSVGVGVDAAWSVHGYQQYGFRAGRIQGSDHRTRLGPADADLASMFNDDSLLAFGTSWYLDVRQRFYPRVDFFGLGQATTSEGRSDFNLEGRTIDLVVQWQRNRHFGLSGRFGKLELDLKDGTNSNVPNTDVLYSPAEAPGIDLQRAYVFTGIAGTLDFRDRANLPSAGTFLAAALWHADALSSPAPTVKWTRVVTEGRQFVTVRNPKHVVALRGFLSTVLGNDREPTPFYLQPTLGGGRTLRGFGSYRLRGDALWTATAEYRWHAVKRLEIAAFVDVGAVADSFAHLGDSRPAVTPGIGLRGRTASRVIGRMDLAGGRDGVRLIFTLGAPF